MTRLVLLQISRRALALGFEPDASAFRRIRLSTCVRCAVLWLCFAASAATRAQAIEGLAEPVRQVEVASPESGTIEKVVVRQGQKVKKGDALVQMDSEILLPALQLAKAKSEIRAKLDAAKIEVQVKQRRLENLARLGKENSSSEEMIRATADVELAQTQVMAAEEEIRQNLLEVKRIEVQLERRTIRSPIDGIITRIHHFNGEYITNSEPYVATVVDLSQLRLVFFVPSLEAEQLSQTTSAEVRLERPREIVATTVDFVSPVTSADSGTVRVELLLDNKAGNYRSGLRCSLSGTSIDDTAQPRFESARRPLEIDVRQR